MRILFLAATLALTACGGAGETAAPVDPFVLGEPQYKQPNVKQTTRAYKEAFKLAKTYKPEVVQPLEVEEVMMDHRKAVANAEALLRAPKTAKEDSAEQQKYFKGIRTVRAQDCQWSRVSQGAKNNFLYNLQNADAERGWLCRSEITLKLCPKCDRKSITGIMLFVQRGSDWVFLGAREYDEAHGIGCSWKNFLGTSSMPANGLGCVEPVGETWPLASS